MQFEKLVYPLDGERVEIENGQVLTPSNPVVCFIQGDGIGEDITPAMHRVLDAAIKKAYAGERKICWFELFAGEKAVRKYNEPLPEDTLRAIRHFKIAIKGPLTTPVGGGFRSLNVRLRQELDLYACVRPVRYFKGVPSPVRHPEEMNIVIFRENTEDVYTGLEWPRESQETKKIVSFLQKEFKIKIREDSGLGLKPISEFATKRLMRMAIKFALKNKRKSITIMHKGNIMKWTEGAFKNWCYEVARDEFRDRVILEEELSPATSPLDKILIKDRIADSMFQQILTRTLDYDIIVTTNLNGDYISDAAAAQVGGLGMAPGANISEETALFEATHGTAPKYAGLDMVNPCSLILSGVMLLEHIGWQEPAHLITKAIEKTILQKKVTYDLARQMEGATEVKTSEFAKAIIENMTK